MNAFEKEEELTRELLEIIETQENVTQRGLADKLNVALGLTNSYLKRCVNKGFIKVKQVPANRYLYYLTPKGFAEKSRLSAKYLSTSFDFYRRASESIVTLYNQCLAKGWKRIVLCGESELAEIAYIRSQELEIHVLGLWDQKRYKSEYLGLPVWKKLEDIVAHDACLVTNVSEVANTYDEMKKKISDERILIPTVLGFRRPA
ncbi:MAG: winged helix-turn-helix transcriptional regulator [Gammaproteobacteria bacterium]|jgi:DNA-binding MarR family transcriptional regulator|nr:winged helix-turn-helix transcriptional regulator [Gammaproteobacteria bacterium]